MSEVTEGQAADNSPPPAVVEDAIRSAQRGDWDDAIEKLESLIASSPHDLIAWLTLAGVKGQSGDAHGEFIAIQQALSVDPYYVPALLLKGNWYQRQGNGVLAASSYQHALEVSPPKSHWPEQIRAELLHADAYLHTHNDGMRQHLSRELGTLQSKLGATPASIWQEAISIRAGQSAPFLSNSNQLHIPRLPAIPFFDRTEFPFLQLLEDNTSIIRDELSAALRSDDDAFQPYIAYRPGEPVNQWKDLNHSKDWNALHLWRNGVSVDDNLCRCPETANLLEQIALCNLSGLCPNVFFSALAPGAHIPPHFGESNARVIAHLPLIIPDNCRLRVGFEQREWHIGETLIFDDTLEHEAWNDSDEIRVVLIFDLWNPLLTNDDREMASALAAATRSYRGV